MTTIFPSDNPPAEMSPAKVAIYRDLATSLPVGWRAWCGVKVQIPGPVFGEGDFLLADPERGLLVLWVMDGRIESIDGRWYQNQQEMLSSPLDQAHGFRSKLQRAIKDYGIDKLAVGVAVCFPESEAVNVSASTKFANVVLTSDQTANLCERLPALFAAALPAPCPLPPQTLAALERLWSDGRNRAVDPR